jgi:hypothetical protein
MYTSCIFCHSSLGTNEAIEHFPVGRRLAFDSAKGRLWVVCRKCARWNLTPLEERWEAIEECERQFSSTRMRASTDNVGLARLPDGLELVRIGSPQRPEFAAWRYGDQFGRRYRRQMVYAGALTAAGVGALITGPVLGLAIGGAVSAINTVGIFANLINQNRIRARIAVPGKDRPAVVRMQQLGTIRLVSDGDAWHLRMPYDRGILIDKELKREVKIEGEAALRAAATILAVSNAAGADKARVQKAVHLVSETPHVSLLFVAAARRAWKADRERNRSVGTRGGLTEVPLTRIPPEVRLAMEIGTNEDIERRAMEGELAVLEEAWRQAEEIAQIADNLALPESASAELGKLKGGSTRSAD